MEGEKIYPKLRMFNLVMGVLHFAQGVLMVLLSNSTKLTSTTSFLKWDEALGKPITQLEEFISIPAGPAVASFLFISAFFHFLIASPFVYDWYVKNLKKKINYLRWYEYAFSSSVMIVLIGMLSGVFDFPTLVLLFALNASMNLFGLMMELHNQTTEKTNWTAFIYGCFSGIVPWIVVAWYFFSAISSAGDAVPTFVYFILVSLFIFFNIFPINMVLQYMKVGPWKRYEFGEFIYIVLSLVAKSLLAWQVFGGTLR